MKQDLCGVKLWDIRLSSANHPKAMRKNGKRKPLPQKLSHINKETEL